VLLDGQQRGCGCWIKVDYLNLHVVPHSPGLGVVVLNPAFATWFRGGMVGVRPPITLTLTPILGGMLVIRMWGIAAMAQRVARDYAAMLDESRLCVSGRYLQRRWLVPGAQFLSPNRMYSTIMSMTTRRICQDLASRIRDKIEERLDYHLGNALAAYDAYLRAFMTYPFSNTAQTASGYGTVMKAPAMSDMRNWSCNYGGEGWQAAEVVPWYKGPTEVKPKPLPLPPGGGTGLDVPFGVHGY